MANEDKTKKSEPTPATVADAETGEVMDTADFVFKTQNYTVKRAVTLAVLKFPENATIVCKIVTPVRQGKALQPTGRGGETMKPADLIDIESVGGEKRTLVLGEVVRRELEDAYPEAGYVGRWFAITKFPIAAGKRYHTYSVVEIEDPTSNG